MKTPEGLPDWGWDEVSENLPNSWSMHQLINQERQDRYQAFEVLRDELERVELLGTDDRNRFSYHVGSIDGGSRLHVYFDRTSKKGVGQYNRVWVNIISPIENDGLELRAYDYAISCSENLIAVNEDTRVRTHHDKMWPDTKEILAPILWVNEGKLRVTRSANYKFAVPHDDSEAGANYLQVLDRRAKAERLTHILRHLTESTREDYIT